MIKVTTEIKVLPTYRYLHIIILQYGTLECLDRGFQGEEVLENSE